jgi:hypothetical protein
VDPPDEPEEEPPLDDEPEEPPLDDEPDDDEPSDGLDGPPPVVPQPPITVTLASQNAPRALMPPPLQVPRVPMDPPTKAR